MNDVDMQAMLASYQPSEEAKSVVRASKIVLLVGITGAGKNTIKRELLKEDRFYDYISHTTRQPRSNHGVLEEDGVDYFFIDHDEARQMISAGDFIEVKKVHSNIYGTAIEGLAPSSGTGRVAVNDVDVQGVDEYKTISPAVHAIFVLPPSFDEWNRRRMGRYGDSIDPEDNQVRLQSAKLELEHALSKGYYDFVINDDVHDASRTIADIVDGKNNTADSAVAEQLARDLYAAL